MPEGNGNATWRPGSAALGSAVVLVALLATYANHFHNSFHFDDAHTVVNNASIRALKNVPLFFRDATTFSSLPSNQSYRPLVSTLLALAYYFGGGLEPVWFHILIFTLFGALTLLLGLVIHRLLEQATSSSVNQWVAIAAAAWYGLHPANADTVNYIIASSEVILTLGVIASFAVYLVFPRWRRSYVYVLPAAIATLAKPPAAIFAVLFAIYRVLLPSDTGSDRTAERGRTFWAEIIVPLIVCAGVLLVVQKMTPPSWVAGATSAHSYLITQPYVAMLYFKTFFWPSALSADYDLNPFASTNDPRFWVGCAFVVLLAAGAIWSAWFKKTRVIGFGFLWFFVALLSTSALPLAEVMNDHRTFFPYIGLIIAGAAGAALLIDRIEKRAFAMQMTVIFTLALFLCASGAATFQRNKVWKTEATLSSPCREAWARLRSCSKSSSASSCSITPSRSW
jgi:MFS family permease